MQKKLLQTLLMTAILTPGVGMANEPNFKTQEVKKIAGQPDCRLEGYRCQVDSECCSGWCSNKACAP